MALNYITSDTTLLTSSNQINLIDATNGSITITLCPMDGTTIIYLSRVDTNDSSLVTIKDNGGNTVFTMSISSQLHLITYNSTWYQF